MERDSPLVDEASDEALADTKMIRQASHVKKPIATGFLDRLRRLGAASLNVHL